MSYAGIYGDDETCRHGHYWRSCGPCSLVGPKATEEQIEAALERRRLEIQRLSDEEAERRQAYQKLTHPEKVVADAFWAAFLKAYPGVDQHDMDQAVQGQADSWVVGRARGICGQAQLAVAAMRGANL